ncbi:MAG: PPOX class F420-dependent oxidoreductase [Candidatus Tectimicrobiota bacterium]
MDMQEAQRFLQTHSCAVLATRRRNGQPQLSPVTVGIDEAGRAVVSSRAAAYKVRNIRRDPQVSLCVFVDNFYGDWVQIDGRAEVLDLPEAMEPLVAYYRQLEGEHPDWEDYRRAMQRDQRVLLRITIERAGPQRKG